MPSPRRAFLHLVACVAIALGAAMSEVWSLGPRQRRGARRLEIDLDLDRIEVQIRILCAWFHRSGHRPRYAHREWLLILEHAERWAVSAAEMARDFVVSPATVHRWLKRRREGPLGMAPAKPVPPCRRIDDSRRTLVADMAREGFAGNRTISRHVHLHGETISPRSVGRFRRDPLGLAHEPKKRRRKPPKEAPDIVDACASHVPGPEHLPRPRVARLLRTLVDAFTEGIATDTLRRLDEGTLYETEPPLLRSRRAEQLAILHGRFRRISPRHRPRFTPTERATILALKHRFRLANHTLAAWFLLDPATLSDWSSDVDRPEQRKRPLVQPLPDVETALASVAVDLPYVPKRLKQVVEEALAALASKVPVRKRRTPRRQVRIRPPKAGARCRQRAPIRADYPNHYWSSDLTTLELGRQFYLASIIDLYSRHVLVWELFARQPSSEQVTVLFDRAVARCGKPKHFVSDQGAQFVGHALERALGHHGIDRRRGAIGQHGSIAIIERLWRTAKDCLDLKAVRPNVPTILRERIAVVIDYYNTKRPHTALGDATPAQVHAGEASRAADAKPAPRGWRGELSPPVPFVIRHAFPAERELPYLERVA